MRNIRRGSHKAIIVCLVIGGLIVSQAYFETILLVGMLAMQQCREECGTRFRENHTLLTIVKKLATQYHLTPSQVAGNCQVSFQLLLQQPAKRKSFVVLLMLIPEWRTFWGFLDRFWINYFNCFHCKQNRILQILIQLFMIQTLIARLLHHTQRY